MRCGVLTPGGGAGRAGVCVLRRSLGCTRCRPARARRPRWVGLRIPAMLASLEVEAVVRLVVIEHGVFVWVHHRMELIIL